MEALAWPIAALLGLIFLALLFRRHLEGLLGRAESIGKHGIKTYPRDLAQSQTSAPEPTAEALVPGTRSSIAAEKLTTEEALRGYDTPIILQRDRDIREYLDRLGNPGDREKVLIRHLAGSLVARAFDNIYAWIYGSQISVLTALNSAGTAGLSVEEVRFFYDDAAARNPESYGAYRFEQWIGYLEDMFLISESGNRFAITDWGHEFLVLLAQSKRPVFKPL